MTTQTAVERQRADSGGDDLVHIANRPYRYALCGHPLGGMRMLPPGDGPITCPACSRLQKGINHG